MTYHIGAPKPDKNKIHMPQLPILEVLDEIVSTLNSHNELVLEAPPGAGKTTQVPLALKDARWAEGKKIVMLEPRRVAARAAAERMASALGEEVGETVGYRIRQENKTSKATKIMVVTEGILTRWIQSDPSLEDVAIVIFDEFHERHLDSDLGLALCLQARELFREADPLKLIIMSATLDGQGTAEFLGGAPLIQSKGKSFEVELKHTNTTLETQRPDLSLVSRSIVSALQERTGNILVFLPGISEIERVKQGIKQIAQKMDVVVHSLHGSLSLDQQRLAITSSEQERKVVLATDIAESSLTINGIQVVIDSGLTRKPEFDPRTGMTRLATKRVSLSSADQRSGRAGRLGPGTAIRLWSKHDESLFQKQIQAEIKNADLGHFALQLFSWGVNSPKELKLLDQPNDGAFKQAVSLLLKLGALEKNGLEQFALSKHGQTMAALPAHPRIAHMLICGKALNQTEIAAKLAAIMSEKTPQALQTTDILSQLKLLEERSASEKQHSAWRARVNKQANQYQQTLNKYEAYKDKPEITDNHDLVAYLVACAYPDRIAKRQGAGGEYKLSNGRRAKLKPDDTLFNSEWLVISDIGGKTHRDTDFIYTAAKFSEHLLEDALRQLVKKEMSLNWDTKLERFNAEQKSFVEKLCFKTEKLSKVPDADKSNVILSYLQSEQLQPLTWSQQASSLCERISFVRKHSSDSELASWPDFSRSALTANAKTWLGPYLEQISTLKDIENINVYEALSSALGWNKKQELDQLAPEFVSAPSGSKVRINYAEDPPVYSVKLQEMFGCSETPRIFKNRVALSLHLLSPARRPLQVTQDLRSFWLNSYEQVKKEMRGRYPKHPWPDDPLAAQATRFTKHRKPKA